MDGIQYNGNVIDIIQTEAGLARKSGTTYSFEYNLLDHLGNVRYSFNRTTAGVINRIQSDDYYPFGLRKLTGNAVNQQTSICITVRSYRKSLDSMITGLGSMTR